MLMIPESTLLGHDHNSQVLLITESPSGKRLWQTVTRPQGLV